MKPKVVIIILNWNGLADTLECLGSLAKSHYRHAEVVVVDNGSTDQSAEIIVEKYPQVKVIVNKENEGFCRGNNIGMYYAMENGADYIWLLNNDTIVETDTLNKIIETGEKSDSIGLVSPLIYYHDNPNQWQFAGSYLNWEDLSLVYPEWNNDLSEKYQIGKDVCLWGTALLIKGKVIKKMGYLKEEYFAYWEDTEYSIRSMMNGFRNVVCREGRVYHKNQLEDSNGGKKREHFYYFMQRNRIFLGDEYFKKATNRLIFRIRYIAGLSDYVRRCGKENIDPCMNGAWHGFKGITGPMGSKDKMPSYLKHILVLLSRLHPVFLADLVTLNFSGILRKISKVNLKK